MTPPPADPRQHYFNHVNLSTGESRPSYRSEVSDAKVRNIHELLRDALAHPATHVAIAATGCTMTAAATHSALAVAVWGPLTELSGQVPSRPALVTVGVAVGTAFSDQLWRLLHATHKLCTETDSAPPLPWIGTRTEIGITSTPTQVAWLQDFERCVAWAWLELPGK